MSHGSTPDNGTPQMGYEEGLLSTLNRIMSRVNELIVKLSMIALLAAALILTLSVVTRYLLKVSTDWQDETSVFLLVGAIFMCGAYVQSYRGHVGIEALAGILPPKINRLRKIFIDLFSFAFCAFFSWKSWAMLHEAWAGGHTTASTFAPPLWIPYGLLAAGMSNLTLQILLQIPAHFMKDRSAP
jgi:TRAP-type C4-dicarboxylate transport system permease small subunit